MLIMKYFMFLSTWIEFLMLFMLTNAQSKFPEHFVRLGNPWGLECSTPYKYEEPPSWVFMNTDGSYDHYIYTHGKFDSSMETRYNITSTTDGQIFTLKVSKTDKDHAGYYGCLPDASSLEGRQFYKLIIIEYSHMNISINANKSTTLYMDISFLSFDPMKPVFQCTFSYGKRNMEEIICDVYKNYDFMGCSLKKLFEPDDDVPHRCKIFLNNKLWSQENLFLNPAPEIKIVKKGTPWNITCESASSYPMKWLFNSYRAQNKSIVLYSKWIPNKNYIHRYNFHVSNNRKLFDMIIPRVDINYSGTYMCIHKSSDHLTERRFDLLVVDESSIYLTHHQQLIMFMCYMGNNNNNVVPSFKCDIKGTTMNMTNMVCQIFLSGLTMCYLIESYEPIDDIPEKCYIYLGDQLIDHVHLSDDGAIKYGKVYDPWKIIAISLITISVSLPLNSIILILFRGVILKNFKKFKCNNQDFEESNKRNGNKSLYESNEEKNDIYSMTFPVEPARENLTLSLNLMSTKV